MMGDRVFARALVLAGEPEEQELLRLLCDAAVDTLTSRLREGLTAEDCREAFVTGAAMLAAASMAEYAQAAEFRAGDMTVKLREGAGAALRQQAEGLLGPYLRDRFLFTGV